MSCFVSHRWSRRFRPRPFIFAGGLTTYFVSLLWLVIFGFHGALCGLRVDIGGEAAAPGAPANTGQPSPSLPHQEFRLSNGLDRTVSPWLRSDGDRAQGNRLDLHFFTHTFRLMKQHQVNLNVIKLRMLLSIHWHPGWNLGWNVLAP